MSKFKTNYMEFMLLARERIAPKTKASMKGSWSEPVTEEQKEALHNYGIGVSGMSYYGQAKIVLKAAAARKERGLATPSQMRSLYMKGIEDVHKRTFKEAAFILEGGDPDSYTGLIYTFRYEKEGVGAEQSVRGRKKANELFQQLRTIATNIQVAMVEE